MSVRNPIFVALVLIILLVPVTVVAQTTTEFTWDVDYEPTGSNDEKQNRLDPNCTNNKETWDPVPQGVYVGGFTSESKMAMSMVPDTNASVCMAQVLHFEANQIMSGASKWVVRLPMWNTTWYEAELSLYMITRGSNWTFEKSITYVNTQDHRMNPLKINFTSGDNHLAYYSRQIMPDDFSPTNGNDHYSRGDRTFVIVSAPIFVDTYYLIVTTAHYAADSKIYIYWEPDSISNGFWNRSTLATYNENDPDDWDIVQENFNISLGYSFDFRIGLGMDAMAGYSRYFYIGDYIEFFMKLDVTQPGIMDRFLTFHFPFDSTILNLSVRTVVMAFNFSDYHHVQYTTMIDNGSQYYGDGENYWQWNDFILVSPSQNLSTLLSGWNATAKSHWQGWCKVRLHIWNDTRIRFYMRGTDFLSPTGYNLTWGNTGLFSAAVFIWAPNNNQDWDPLSWFSWTNSSGDKMESVAFTIQADLQLNNYYWDQNTNPVVVQKKVSRTYKDMTFGEKVWFTMGHFLIVVGKSITPIFPIFGPYVTAAGMTMELQALYGQIPSWAGWLTDGLNWVWDKLSGAGQWLWKVGQQLWGAIKWFVESLIYYGSIILAILIFIIAYITFFTPLWFTLRIAMAVRKALLGDFEGARAEISEAKKEAARKYKAYSGAGRKISRKIKHFAR